MLNQTPAEAKKFRKSIRFVAGRAGGYIWARMNSLWSDAEAAQFAGDLGQRVYTSRLLGRDKSLVLHGGGNTSVKSVGKNIFGEDEPLLFVKGSGWDLSAIDERGFSPVRMAPLLRMAQLKTMTDSQMENELITSMTRAGAPTPSVETILHASLPYKFVDHTHADAIISITNSPGGEARIREIFGKSVVVIPYIMPGFDLARLCAEIFPKEATSETIGMVLMNHGIFSFGATARESYERMIALATKAEDYLKAKGAWDVSAPPDEHTGFMLRHGKDLAELRREISEAAGGPMIVSSRPCAFARRLDMRTISQRGPATPDHVIRTKRLPMAGCDVQGFARAYETYFNEQAPKAKQKVTMLDRAPRVALDPSFGLCGIGKTAKDAAIAAEIYEHTIDIILRAEKLGGWQALSAKDLFDVEYWELEQAKLTKKGAPPLFAGEVVLVTGAASGIGKASVESFLKRGAAVVGLDINPAITTMLARADFVGLPCDLTNESAVAEALEKGARAFGGLDMVVLNAGIFPGGAKIADMKSDLWRKVMGINLDANLTLLRECHPYLKLAPRGGRVVIIGSKNVAAPGPGAAAYSASKAAMNQLARVAALEWGADKIRVNSIHPNQVFDTGLWTEEVLQARAKHYGLTVEQYKTNNVLKTEIKSGDVAEMAAEMCGPLFAKTTGAGVPLDGGTERII
jgi:rhamnose utilization protein RhaD (predicted bifunctional aldolase and dehydrogenase)/NAD(P)-dependent dehydrogenase (short-subunit alcohol dehydrogenase family)